MAITGYYDDADSPAPFVEARIYLPRLELGASVELLLDSGADSTTLHIGDVGKFGVSIESLSQERVLVRGIGGSMGYVQEPAYVSFYDRDAAGWRYFRISIALCAPDDALQEQAVSGLPSLLGRDILNRCKCVLDPSLGNVTLEPFPSVGFLPAH